MKTAQIVFHTFPRFHAFSHFFVKKSTCCAALLLSPVSPVLLHTYHTQACMHLARALKSAGQPGRAVDVYKSLLQLQPDHPTAHFKLGSVLRHMGRHEAAAEAYRCACIYTHIHAHAGVLPGTQLRVPLVRPACGCTVVLHGLPRLLLNAALAALSVALWALDRRQQLAKDPNHVQAAFWLAALTPGPQVSCCPPEIVAKLFDGYADHFDENLTNKLHYRTPAVLMDTVLQHSGQQSSQQQAQQQHTHGKSAATPPQQQQQQQQQRFAHCVDLGCGTGLMGPLLRPHTQQLVGVDLSQGMVAKAQERGCYDVLAVDELVRYLEGAAAAVEQQGRTRSLLLVCWCWCSVCCFATQDGVCGSCGGQAVRAASHWQ